MDLHYLVDGSHHLPPLNPNPNPNLGPKISTAFKREERRKRKERKRQKKLEEKLEHELQTLLALDTHSLPSHPAPISNIDWPCNAIASNPISSESGWVLPNPNPNPNPAPLPSAALPDPQKNVLKQCQDFFSIHDDDDEEDEYLFEFFEGQFAKDENLRGYYEKNWEKGEFCCLVCGGIGEKLGKRFGDCVGLVQHANTVLKTKRVGGHRAFGRAVCGVLGWDVDKLPSILMGKDWEGIDEVGLHNEVGDLVGPDKGDKGDSMDYMETDDDADTD